MSDNTESAAAEGPGQDNPVTSPTSPVNADAVLCEVDGPVAVVTINRPAARNAVNGAVAAGMAAALDDLEARQDVQVIVLTGAGGTFCAGMDLKGFLAGENPMAGGRGFAGIVERPPVKPVIAAVEGYALAGGFEVALSCDLIVASEEAAFGLPEVTRGLAAAAGGLLRLPRRIPYHLAMEVALTGDRIPAPQLHRAGLINRLVPAGQALAAATDLARRLSRNAPLALAAARVCHDARAALARHLPDPAVAVAEDALAIGLATLGSRPHRPVRASTPGVSCGSAGPEISRDPDD